MERVREIGSRKKKRMGWILVYFHFGYCVFVIVVLQLRQNVANVFVTVHQSVVEVSDRMLVEMKRRNYVTPTNYLELVTGYKL